MDVIEQLKAMNAKRILLQIPDGLKPSAFRLFNMFSKDFNVIISSQGFYGACDIGNREIYDNVDCIVQFGHSEIPNIKYPKPVIFIEYRNDVIELDESIFYDLKKYNTIGLLSSIQYYDEMLYVSDILKRLGIKTVIGKTDKRMKYPGQVLGCNFSAVHSSALDVDAFLVVSTGMFHAIGAQLASDKDVYLLDLNERRIKNIKNDVDLFIRRRYLRISRALDARKFCVLMDTKIGQYRRRLAEHIYRELLSLGKDAILVTADNVNPYDIENLRCDAVVFTGCPRVSLDDEEKFSVPVLTPQEFKSLFIKRSNKYIMDEIVSVD
ncbi:diphthamide biosynthesis enzyme Dph2 [Picrophilus oshimae]|uniref:2-(3-amino-3-carboxypropyl)histidine synthase n=1 Tax=Picrophilus torridus (strain ATCC 700027 / DSM 9790 / JCM 10055 / NBRC 100828 / KAW 2/3) TaxID=1122961 RepID=Q6L1Y7_PICTO|nr:diphthamide biosynthesis enzyme Dph2 [Picrophilus oshimae]AAT43015.1 diphthamide synthase subunit DPH2 [Picrophilus oshimae DSM 9789]SMD30683.1 2-(3-amino-3-carboxypropyl)histidine synthase [Picrophilus oshimae DSM 9789]